MTAITDEQRTGFRAIHLAICDPGAFVERGFETVGGERLYESVTHWAARAVVHAQDAELATFRDGAHMLGRIVTTNARIMEAARIELVQGSAEKAMQWILNALPDQWDGEPGSEWDGFETAQEWFDRAEKPQ